MTHHRRALEVLADAALAGPWDVASIHARFERCVRAEGEAQRRFLRHAARRLAVTFPEAPTDRAALIGRLRALRERAVSRDPSAGGALRSFHVTRVLLPARVMRPAPFAAPPLLDAADVASHLELRLDALDWLADVRGMNPKARDARLHHYVCRLVPKRSGGARLLEAPKPTLAIAQRRLLDRVLCAFPVHEAAKGFVPGRDLLDHVGAHVGKRVVVRMDLTDFFAQVGFARVRGLFAVGGYPREVAGLLAGLATTSTPRRALRALRGPEHRALRERLAASHLPQGAPSSPMLANLVAFGLDRRLAGLARALGGVYTRYADDLAFSGDASFERRVDALLPRVGAIALEEGLTPNHRKTRVMRAGGRQELCGVIVNRKLSVRRAERERLEAILVDCARRGPEAANREGHADFRAHLDGRVGWIERLDPRRGASLRARFDAISWDRGATPPAAPT